MFTLSKFWPADASAPPSDLLLDELTAVPVAAYSVRKLRTDYAGSAIRVRRSSDSTESDIGFSSDELDTSALTTFCGAGDGFIVTWYDQQNSNNVTNSTASAQPQIVSGGSIITGANSKPAISGDGAGDQLFDATVSISAPVSVFAVLNQDTWGSGDSITGFNRVDSLAAIRQTGSSPTISVDGQSAAIAPALDTWFIAQFRIQTNNFLARLNADSASTDVSGTISGGTSSINLFTDNDTFFDGLMQEVIIFGTSAPDSTDEDTIRNNQNDYFVIF